MLLFSCSGNSEGHMGVGMRKRTTKVRGGDEREVLGAGRGVRLQAGEVETPAMAAEARGETRLGAECDEECDGGDGVQDSERVGLRNTYA